MPEGSDHIFRRVLSGLLVLAIFVMPVVQVRASIVVAMQSTEHVAPVAHHNDSEIATLPPSHDHSQSPCKNHEATHGLPCCFAGSCSMLAGWLTTASPSLPWVRQLAPIYWASSTPSSDDLGGAPARKPPRLIV